LELVASEELCATGETQNLHARGLALAQELDLIPGVDQLHRGLALDADHHIPWVGPEVVALVGRVRGGELRTLLVGARHRGVAPREFGVNQGRLAGGAHARAFLLEPMREAVTLSLARLRASSAISREI